MTFPTITLPPHDPNRSETTDGFGDPEITNSKRASEALHILNEFAKINESSDFADIIANLLHLAHSLGFDPNEIQTSALGNFHAEAGPLPKV